MNFKKLITLGTLILFIKQYTLSAMALADTEVPIYVIEYILDFIYQPNPMIPVSYLNYGQALSAFSRANKTSRLLSLHYIENRIINQLIKIKPSNEPEIISTCCAFKIISKIRETSVDYYGKYFCEQQFQQLTQLYFFNTSFKEMCLQPIHWLISKIIGYDTYFFNASQNALISEKERIKIIIQAILKEQDINYIDQNGVTALHWAVANNQPQITTMLLTSGANVDTVVDNKQNHKEFNSFTSLHLAILHNFKKIVSILLLAGANFEAIVDNTGSELNGYKPLHIASELGFNEIIHDLVNAGANINARILRRKKIMGKTPLHIAAQKNDIQTVKQLLALGANPNLPVQIHRINYKASELTTNPEIQHIIQQATYR